MCAPLGAGRNQAPDLPHLGDVLPHVHADALAMTDIERTAATTTTPAQLAEAARGLWDPLHAGDVEAVLASFGPEPARRFWAAVDTGVPA